MSTENTEAEKVRDIERAANPVHTVGNDRQIIIVPTGYKVEDLEKYLDVPARMRAQRTFHDVESFIAYCSDFKDGFAHATSRLFADRNRTTFLAILDYTGWKEHTAKYTCPLSDEWKIWEPGSGHPMTQQQFAQFIEDNLPDIYKPVGAEMLEISRTLEAKKNVNFLSETRLHNSTVDFTFEEKVEATANKGKLQIPQTFTIKIPVFTNSEIVEIVAKLRYKLDSGKLSLWYELERPHKVLDIAFNNVRKIIENDLAITALMGDI